MTVARNLVWWLLAPYFVLLTINAWVRFDREVKLFDSDMRHDHVTFAKGLGAAVRTVWATRGVELAREVVLDADPPTAEVDVHWVALDGGAPGERLEGDEPLRADLLAGRTVQRELSVGSEQRLVTFFPIDAHLGQHTALRVSESLASKQKYVRASVRNTVIFHLAIIVSCTVVATMVGAWLVGRPVQQLVEQARRIGRGELDARVEPVRQDELGVLVEEMNSMAERLAEAHRRTQEESAARLAAIEQLRQADRLTTVGRLASGIAHELGTPLNVVAGRASLIAEVTSEQTARDDAKIIVSEVDRMAAIIRQLLDFARHRAPDRFEQDVSAIVKQVFTLLGPMAEGRHVQFELDATRAVPASVDGAQIQQVLTNLIVNGIQAMPDGGKLRVEFDHGPRTPPEGAGASAGEFLTVSVCDEGEGISDEVRSRVFEPFFTTKGVGEGTGLGLSVSYGIVREHGGFLDLETKHGVGSTFHVHLPLR
jgi:two-component system NtrC family sensor kinase